MDEKLGTQGDVLDIVKPCGWTKNRIEELAKAFAYRVGFKYGDWLEDYIVKAGGRMESSEYGGWDKVPHFRNFSHETLKDNAPVKFHINTVADENVLEENYIAAVLVSHHILHCPEGEKIMIEYDPKATLFGSDWEVRQEAIVFAMSLLMPAKDFREEWEKRSKKSILPTLRASDAAIHDLRASDAAIHGMCKIFKVRRVVIRARIRNLGLSLY